MRSPIQNNKKVNNGFTLVELLVVISIIAIMLAVLMPSLQKARKLARQIVCGSNQKQLAYGLMAYSADNEGYIMPAALMFKKGTSDYTKASEDPRYRVEFMNANLRKNGGWKSAVLRDQYWFRHLYLTTVNNADAFFCPSISARNAKNFKDLYGREFGEDETGTYALREWTYADGMGYRGPKKVSKLPTPSDFFLITDSVNLNDKLPTPKKAVQYYRLLAKERAQSFGLHVGVGLRHGSQNDKKSEAVFADGHVGLKNGEYFTFLQDTNNWQAKYCMYSKSSGYRVYSREKAQFYEWTWTAPTNGSPSFTKTLVDSRFQPASDED